MVAWAAVGGEMARSEQHSEGDSTGLGRVRKSLREGKPKSHCQAWGCSSWGNRVALDVNEGKDEEMLIQRLR